MKFIFTQLLKGATGNIPKSSPFVAICYNFHAHIHIVWQKKCKQRDQNVILDFDKTVILDFDKTQINTLDRQTAFGFFLLPWTFHKRLLQVLQQFLITRHLAIFDFLILCIFTGAILFSQQSFFKVRARERNPRTQVELHT